MLSLAKPALDVGLFTNRWDEMRAFYVDGLGVPYDELLPIGGGVRQHRLALPAGGGILKVNDSRDPLPESPTGYVGLTIIGPSVEAGDAITDPDGLEVGRRPAPEPGTEIEIAAADPDAFDRFLTEALGADREGDGRYRLATTVLTVRHQPGQPRAEGAMNARGFRYLTVQVRDVVAEHARLVGLGVEEGSPPRKLGEVAMISFVRDPGGNWIEISQRASLTGPLPS